MGKSTIINLECPHCGNSWYFDPEEGYRCLDDKDRNKMRLFAAAPDLLAACEAWARIMTVAYIPTAELMLNGLPPDAVQQAEELTRLAIRKARGEI